ncbi:phosphoethanolamine transferase [Photobacterium ganghwense]|uniref:Hydrolase n=1 Tax=Photobacterium ganghwense TaxID=320778 RepID=A0A0J1JQJ7_9GAMM|nr:phosphoethanolamine--lipid A transferase [Photobacterium ganghwense]KLV04522.1 hydrolase [Photobacterium ganghwense]PSU09400.1 phosphoethanolamine transferase [Photobacterium ganghwense]QSV16591.1 phosphoethanolamine--lipid A transferase [Photobacterium ganghwense]
MRYRLSSSTFTLIVALYFTLFQNIALWQHLAVLFYQQPGWSWGFALSLPLVILTLMNLVFTVLIWPRGYRWMLMVLVVASTAVTYGMSQFGVVFDYGMMVNIFETDFHEATSYLSLSVLWWFLGLVVLPLWAVQRAEVRFPETKRRLLISKCLSLSASVLILVVIAGVYYKDYASLLRNHSEVKSLINPTSYTSAGFRVLKNRWYESRVPFTQIGTDAVNLNAGNTSRNVMVLVVGETARASNYALNGYSRNTNPFLIHEDVHAFRQVASCGTATAASLPCMFSNMRQEEYSAALARRQEGLLDVLQHAGIDVLWKDNNSGSKGVSDRVRHIQITPDQDAALCPNGICFDGILLKNMDKELAALKGDGIIVLHLLGSHGPTYYQRYPESFEVYKPVCRSSEIQHCSAAALLNTYDNTLVYTDYILSQVIIKLKRMGDTVNTAMLYLSDHGESLGEKGIYLHGMPYTIAPETQTRVPMITWFSASYQRQHKINRECVSRLARKADLSHDNLFHTVLGMMQVQTREYDAHLDIFAICKE